MDVVCNLKRTSIETKQSASYYYCYYDHYYYYFFIHFFLLFMITQTTRPLYQNVKSNKQTKKWHKILALSLFISTIFYAQPRRTVKCISYILDKKKRIIRALFFQLLYFKLG